MFCFRSHQPTAPFFERTDLELLTKRTAHLGSHRILMRMVQQRAFEFYPIARGETEGHKEFCLGRPARVSGIQQILNDLPIVQDCVCNWLIQDGCRRAEA
jgi:hypothetical protein